MLSSRTYTFDNSVIFRKTKEQFGGLSNMASGYSLNINDIIIPSAEHLYQACRFPYHPDIQYNIIHEPSPMKAKWISRKYTDLTRADWEKVKFKIMEWCLEVKLSQNWDSFGSLLKSTGDKDIVEYTPKDKVWGAVQEGDHFVGTNALGRLLMLMREKYVKTSNRQRCVQPLAIPDFLFLEHTIGLVCLDHVEDEISWSLSEEYTCC